MCVGVCVAQAHCGPKDWDSDSCRVSRSIYAGTAVDCTLDGQCYYVFAPACRSWSSNSVAHYDYTYAHSVLTFGGGTPAHLSVSR